MKILHLYHDLMNLYGEYGNLCMLKRVLEQKGAQVEIIKKSIGDEFDFSDVDMIYIGSGTERNQKVMLEHIKPYSEQLKKFAEEKLMLCTGNSFEIFGKGIRKTKPSENEPEYYPGLGWFDYETTETDERTVIDVTAESSIISGEIIGFINKCTEITGITSPLFNIKGDEGNQKGQGSEGFVSKGFYGTHIIGPLLVRNLNVCEYFANKLNK